MNKNSCQVAIVLESLSEHVSHLKKHEGRVCSASTVLVLLQQCSSLQASMQLLLQSLQPAPRVRARLTSLLDQLQDVTRELHRDGGIALRNNSDVWNDLISLFEIVVSTIGEGIIAWTTKQGDLLHTALKHVQTALKKFAQLGTNGEIIDADTIILKFSFVVDSIAEVRNHLNWWYSCASKWQVQQLKVWWSQLHSALHLLSAAAALLMRDCKKCTFSLSSFLSIKVVSKRVTDILEELISITTLHSASLYCDEADQNQKGQLGAFVVAVDQVLLILLDEKNKPSLECCDKSNSDCDGANNSSKLLTNLKEESFVCETIKDLDVSLFDNIAHLNPHTKDSENMSSCLKITPDTHINSHTANIDVTNLESTLKEQKKRPISQQVKEPLEEILRHVIAIGYCNSLTETRAVMALCEHVLQQLKSLVSVETSAVPPDPIDHALARESLADAVETLERRANTSLIRSYVHTFAMVAAPLDQLVEAACRAESNEGDKGVLPLSGEVADLDLHVDAMFQVTMFAAACCTQPDRVSEMRSYLLTLEWLEGCLVPAILSMHASATQQKYPGRGDENEQESCTATSTASGPASSGACILLKTSDGARRHAALLCQHWRDTATALQQCLDRIMEPAAFVMVSRAEAHRLWWECKQRLYTPDITWFVSRMRLLKAVVNRVLELHLVEPYLTEDQQQLLLAGVSSLHAATAALQQSPTCLRAHRSLLKRAQLLLTLLSRLSQGLAVETDGEESEVEELLHCGIRAKKAHPPPFDDFLLTSDIRAIPVDVATPFVTDGAAGSSGRHLRAEALEAHSGVSDSDGGHLNTENFTNFRRARCTGNVSEDGSDDSDVDGFKKDDNEFENKDKSVPINIHVIETDTAISHQKKDLSVTRDPRCDNNKMKTPLISNNDNIASCNGLGNSVNRKEGRNNNNRTVAATCTVLPDNRLHVDSSQDMRRHVLLRSVSKLGESLVRSACVQTDGLFSTQILHQTPTVCSNSTEIKDDTSLDISKFLPSLNSSEQAAVRSSVRASFRTALLKRGGRGLGLDKSFKVKEINIILDRIITPTYDNDMENNERAQHSSDANGLVTSALLGVLPDTSAAPAHVDNRTDSASAVHTVTVDMNNHSTATSVREENSVGVGPVTSQCVVATVSCEDNGDCSSCEDKLLETSVRQLTDILENLSSVAESFSVMASEPVASKEQRSAVEPQTSVGDVQENKENDWSAASGSSDCYSESRAFLNFSSDASEAPSCSPSRFVFEGDSFLRLWNDSCEPRCNSSKSNFNRHHTNNFTDNLSFLQHATPSNFQFKNCNLDVTATGRTVLKPVNINTKQSSLKFGPSSSAGINSSRGCSVGSSLDAFSFNTNIVSTPESVVVRTPERLFDLQVLKNKLANLKSFFKAK